MFFVQTEAVVEQPKQNCVRKEGSYVLKFQLTTISQPHSVVEEEKRIALLLAQTTQIYTGTHLKQKNYININQRSKTVGKHFSFSTFRSTFVCAQASKQQQHTFFEFQTLSLTYKQKAKNAFKKKLLLPYKAKQTKKTLKKSDTIKKTKKKRG